jgi:mono/diheme cytochrome c family protein
MRALAVGAVVCVAVFALIAAVAGIEGESEDVNGRAEAEPAPAPREVEAGRRLFARMGCGSCHTLAAAGSQGEIGPDLDERLPAHDRKSLTAVITDPPSDGSGFSGMPTNFGTRMSPGELDDLVSFLLAARDAR